jgi:hypothetical protein
MLRRAAMDAYGLLAKSRVMGLIMLFVAVPLGVLAYEYSSGGQTFLYAADTRFGADPVGFSKWQRSVEQVLRDAKAKEEAKRPSAAQTQEQEQDARTDLGDSRETANVLAEGLSGSNVGTVGAEYKATRTASAIQEANEASRANGALDTSDRGLPASYPVAASHGTSARASLACRMSR